MAGYMQQQPSGWNYPLTLSGYDDGSGELYIQSRHSSAGSSRTDYHQPTGYYIDPRHLSTSPKSYLEQDEDDFSFPNIHFTFQEAPRRRPTIVHQTSYDMDYSFGDSRNDRSVNSRIESSLPSPPLSPTPIQILPANSSSRCYCQHQHCINSDGTRRSFSRQADLSRHQKSCHGVEEGHVVKLDCPRPKCSRKGENGFTRRDHLMEHRRGYHNEDLPKRRSSGQSQIEVVGSRRYHR